jgi:hypothetical protein
VSTLQNIKARCFDAHRAGKTELVAEEADARAIIQEMHDNDLDRHLWSVDEKLAEWKQGKHRVMVYGVWMAPGDAQSIVQRKRAELVEIIESELRRQFAAGVDAGAIADAIMKARGDE